MFGKVDDDAVVDGLAALRGAAAARRDDQPVVAGDGERAQRLVHGPRDYDPGGHDLVERGVGRIAAAVGAIEEDVAGNFARKPVVRVRSSPIGHHTPAAIADGPRLIALGRGSNADLPRLVIIAGTHGFHEREHRAQWNDRRSMNVNNFWVAADKIECNMVWSDREDAHGSASRDAISCKFPVRPGTGSRAARDRHADHRSSQQPEFAELGKAIFEVCKKIFSIRTRSSFSLRPAPAPGKRRSSIRCRRVTRC